MISAGAEPSNPIRMTKAGKVRSLRVLLVSILFQKIADIGLLPGRIIRQFLWPESKRLHGVLLQVDIAELHAALVDALNPNRELAASQFQNQQIGFMHRSDPD